MTDKNNDHYADLRTDLAAAFRWTARFNYHEGISNHLSVATSEEGSEFLIQPAGRHFSRVRASELLLLNANNPETLAQENAPDPTAWFLHAYLHKNLPHAKCIIHLHTQNSLALACLKDFEFLMLDQNACRFYNRIAYDRNYVGMPLSSEEGERIAGLMQDGKSILMMGNHGILITAPTIAQAFDELYYFERSAELQIKVMQTGREISVIPDNIAAEVEREWREYPTKLPFHDMHFNALKEILDQEEPDYKL